MNGTKVELGTQWTAVQAPRIPQDLKGAGEQKRRVARDQSRTTQDKQATQGRIKSTKGIAREQLKIHRASFIIIQ